MKQVAGDLILLFVKTPIKGRVKSRLASAVGEEGALDLYRDFVLDILGTLQAEGLAFRICYAPPDSGPALISWLGPGHQYTAQEGKDLGERMKNAFSSVFLEGIERAILIGSDIPDLPGSVIRDAFTVLESKDAVLGPAADGGYYLIGFRSGAFLPQAFDGIPWGTDAVLRCTLDILEKGGRSVRLLPVWNDLDTSQDLEAFFARNHGGLPGSRTLSAVKSLLRQKPGSAEHHRTRAGKKAPFDHE